MISLNVTEWVNEDEVVIHCVQYQKTSQLTFDYVMHTCIKRETDKVIIVGESTEHASVPEKLGIQR